MGNKLILLEIIYEANLLNLDLLQVYKYFEFCQDTFSVKIHQQPIRYEVHYMMKNNKIDQKI